MTIKNFTDSSSDTLRVQNYGSSGDGDLTVTQDGRRAATFSLDNTNRLPLAAEILAPLDAAVIEGPLPNATVTEYNGTKRLKVGPYVGEISEAEKDYFQTQARQALSMVKAIERMLEQEEKERQERLVAAEKRKVRRDELARQFTNTPWAHYSTAPTSTKTAIDRIIELEDAAK